MTVFNKATNKRCRLRGKRKAYTICIYIVVCIVHNKNDDSYRNNGILYYYFFLLLLLSRFSIFATDPIQSRFEVNCSCINVFVTYAQKLLRNEIHAAEYKIQIPTTTTTKKWSTIRQGMKNTNDKKKAQLSMVKIITRYESKMGSKKKKQ